VKRILVRDLLEYSPPLSDIARNLPVWPSVSVDHGYLTAREALVAHSPVFVVPWLTQYHRFTPLEEPFKVNAIDDAYMVEHYILPALPESLDGQTKTSYIRLVAAMACSLSLKRKISKKNKTLQFKAPLKEYRLAAAQTGMLYCAHKLYDHSDDIFSAAFRNHNETKFLMLEIRSHLSFWHEVGLRHQRLGKYAAEDYLSCLHALEDRLSGLHEETLSSDADTILSPLCINDGSLHNLDHSTWTGIATLNIFPVRQVLTDEPEYRRQRMEYMASETPNLCLQSIVRYEFAAVCWSQTPFPHQNPTTDSSRKCGANGQPKCSMVWEHLVFLAELAQSVEQTNVEHFVNDLQETYQYLNLNLQDSKNTFSKANTAIWLNVESLDPHTLSIVDIRSSWATLENLLLDTSCDALPLLAVQPFLGRFSTLLKEIGCRSIIYPRNARSSCNVSTTTFTLVKQLWCEDILTDVRFAAEGQEIAAHKIILASRSGYCKTQFSGPWAGVSQITATQKVIQLEEMTYATLQLLVKFCYEVNLDWAAEYRVAQDDDLSTIADKLDMLLDVLTAADRWVMPDLHAEAQSQVMFGARFFIRVDNVANVKDIADEANAIELREYCDEFTLCNVEAVMLASMDNS
jgi:sacsin